MTPIILYLFHISYFTYQIFVQVINFTDFVTGQINDSHSGKLADREQSMLIGTTVVIKIISLYCIKELNIYVTTHNYCYNKGF